MSVGVPQQKYVAWVHSESRTGIPQQKWKAQRGAVRTQEAFHGPHSLDITVELKTLAPPEVGNLERQNWDRVIP